MHHANLFGVTALRYSAVYILCHRWCLLLQLPRDVAALAAAMIDRTVWRDKQTCLCTERLLQTNPTLALCMLCSCPMQLRHYPALPRDVAGLAALCAGQDITADGKFQWRGEVPVVAFGRHAGEAVLRME